MDRHSNFVLTKHITYVKGTKLFGLINIQRSRLRVDTSSPRRQCGFFGLETRLVYLQFICDRIVDKSTKDTFVVQKHFLSLFGFTGVNRVEIILLSFLLLFFTIKFFVIFFTKFEKNKFSCAMYELFRC